jgi:hypothetical protein
MKISMRYVLIFLWFVSGLTACHDSDKIADRSPVDPDDIYLDYRVTAEEGKDMAAVMLQYRLDDGEGPALALKSPNKVLFDGTELRADSAKLTGNFYEVVKPVREFKGPHTIVFTDNRGKQHKEEFQFIPFTLSTKFPENVRRQPFTIRLNGLPENAKIRLVMADTAFQSPDVNEELFVYNGEIRIDEEKLQNLQNGPVNLEIYAEKEIDLKNPPKAGGRFFITYGLKRQFELVD